MANPFYAIRNFFRGPGAPVVEVGVQDITPAYSKNPAKTVTFDSAMQVSAVWAAVKILSETIASLPLHVYRIDADGNKEKIGGDLVKVLCQRPNPVQTKVEFWEQMALNLTISGNAYAVKGFSGNRLVSLMPVSAAQVEPELLAGGTMVYKITEGSNVRVIPQSRMWHIKLFGNGLVGMSPLEYARNSIGIAQGADDRVTDMYANGAKPSGVLMIDRNLTAEQRNEIRKNYKNLAEGSDDKLYILEAFMKYQQIAMSPQDIQLLDSRRFQIEDIGRFFGVPSILLNQTFGQSSLGSNVSQIMEAFYKINLRPYLEKIESSIVRWLVPEAQQAMTEARFDFDALLRADTLTRMQSYREAINSGQMTPNEARALEGRPSMDGGDILMVQGAMVSIDQAAQPPEPPPAPEPEPDPMPQPPAPEERSVKSQPQQFDIKFEPRISVHTPQVSVDNHIKVDAPDPTPVEVKVDNPEPVINIEAVLPEQKQLAPIVNVDVRPSDVTVIDNHPKRAIQTVERDEDDEITRTIIDYEKD